MKHLLIFFISLLSHSALAQEVTPYFTALIVEDIEVSTAWYSKHFGLKVISETNMPDRGFKQVNLQAEGMLIELLQIDAALDRDQVLAAASARFVSGIFKIGFLISDLEKKAAALQSAGVEFRGSIVYDENLQTNMLIVLDPDGNYVQLFER